jgi:hypothetical protein
VDSLTGFLQRRINATVFIAGTLVGIWFVSLHNFLPWNVDWLTLGNDGSAFHISWEFYRKAPMLQWPITATPTYIEGANTVLASANGIVGIPAKLIGLVFRGQFQFYGLWVAATFGLQALFSFRLLGLFIDKTSTKLAACTLFVLAPTFVFRIGEMSHFEVASHWLILGALYLYFSNTKFVRNWSLLLLLSILISVYITAMLVLIFFAALAKERFVNKALPTLQKLSVAAVAPLLWLFAGFVFMGYLNYGGSAAGTGFFRLNVLAYFNPGFSWTGSFSRIFELVVPTDHRQLFVEDMEMFQYLGIGALVMLVGLAVYLVQQRKAAWWESNSWLIGALVIMLLVAFSHRIGFAGKEVAYWWPEVLKDTRQVFRAASRFGWPLYYALMLGAVVATFRVLPKKWAPAAIGAICLFNVIDVLPGVQENHYHITDKQGSIRAQSTQKWETILANKSHVKVFPNFDLQVGNTVPDAEIFEKNWYLLARLALDHNMSTNFGYVSRPITEHIAREDALIQAVLSVGELDPEVVYIIGNKQTWQQFAEVAGANAKAEEIDGFYVITSS